MKEDRKDTPRVPRSRSDREYPPMHIMLTSSFAERHPKTVERLSKHQLIYSVLGLVLGLSCVIGGVVLFLHGVVGSTSWTARILGAESHISDAAPGAVLFIVGLFFVLVTRYVLKVRH
jgi:hypothetical protein